jgi:NDP-sugar pyrophosphorylase family protein
MRAMILAAGLGTRLQPLSELRPKPAMPVRGIPLIAYSLEWLAHQGVTEAIMNLHHLPDVAREAAERYCPETLKLYFSNELQLLGTGGGIGKAREFLRESDPCLVMAADMLLDLELGPLLARHRARGDAATLVLRDDPRGAHFGTIGLAADGRVRRIGRRLDLGGEQRAGLYLSVTLFSGRAFESMPEQEAFGHLDAWIGARLRRGADDVRGELMAAADARWEPVGIPAEYLAVNLHPPLLSFLDPDRRAAREGTRFRNGLVIGSGAEFAPGARLQRAVVWDGERVPGDVSACDGVFAGGRFHPCLEGTRDP